MGKKRLFFCFGMMFCFLFAPSGYAQNIELVSSDTEREELLLLFEEAQLVTTPTKLEQKISDIPSTVYVISAEEIRKHGYQTLDEVLRDLPGFEFVNSAGWWGMTSLQRGIRGNKTPLILIDGFRDDNLVDSYQIWGQIYPLQSLKRIEVVYGPSSALYGADAFSGVVNLITQDGSELKGGDIHLTGGSFGTRIYELTLGNQTKDKNIDWSFWGRWAQAQGPKLTDLAGYPLLKEAINNYSEADFREYRNRTKNYSLGLKVSDRGFTAGFYLWNRENGGGTLFDPVSFVQKQSLSHYQNAQLYLKKDQKISPKLDSQTSLSYLRTDVFNDSRIWVIDSTTSSVTTPVYQVGNGDRVSFEQQLTYYSSPWHSSVLGVTLEDWLVAPRIQKPNTPPQKSDGLKYYYRQVYGAYWQEEWRYLNLINFVFGARYDRTSDFGPTFNPRAGLVYHLLPGKSSLKFLYGEGFLAPSIYDLYYSDLTNKKTVVAANPELEAQKVRTFELGWNYRLTPFFQTQLSLFKSYLRNTILRSSTGKTTSDGVPIDKFTNRGSSEIIGGEAGLSGRPAKYLSFFTNYSYLKGKETTSKIDFIEDTAKHKANLGLDFSFFDFLHWDISLNWYGSRYTSLRNTVFHGDRISGYTLVNTNIILEEMVKNLELSLRIKNLFNREYFDPADRGAEGWVTPEHPQEKRSIYLQLSYKF
ncbi:MAG: TonB-dependent receptor [Elusimicrobiota bacterium]